jgi:hypothetical protein
MTSDDGRPLRFRILSPPEGRVNIAATTAEVVRVKMPPGVRVIFTAAGKAVAMRAAVERDLATCEALG